LDNIGQRRRVNLGLAGDSRPGPELAWGDVTLMDAVAASLLAALAAAAARSRGRQQ